LLLALDLILVILAISNNPKPSSDAAIAGKIKLVSEARRRDRGNLCCVADYRNPHLNLRQAFVGECDNLN
jgi:hypothetical protein